MKWDEFKALLVGIGPETPLGRIVSVRSEEDKDILKHFTKEQLKIRSDWRRRAAKQVSEEEMNLTLEQLKKVFTNMAGGETCQQKA